MNLSNASSRPPTNRGNCFLPLCTHHRLGCHRCRPIRSLGLGPTTTVYLPTILSSSTTRISSKIPSPSPSADTLIALPRPSDHSRFLRWPHTKTGCSRRRSQQALMCDSLCVASTSCGNVTEPPGGCAVSDRTSCIPGQIFEVMPLFCVFSRSMRPGSLSPCADGSGDAKLVHDLSKCQTVSVSVGRWSATRTGEKQKRRKLILKLGMQTGQ
jgi:hypothetical protein